MRRRREPVLQRRDHPHRLARPRRVHRTVGSRPSLSITRERCSARWPGSVVITWPRRRSRWRRGISSRRRRDGRWRAVLGGTRQRIEAGVSIGIQDSLEELVERVQVERAAGYRRIKIKIRPGWDVAAVARVRDACDDVPLMVDANAAYTLRDADHLAALDRYDLHDDRAAAGLRRPPRSLGAATAAGDAHLPGRIDRLAPRR